MFEFRHPSVEETGSRKSLKKYQKKYSGTRTGRDSKIRNGIERQEEKI
jgi:hypothetical protein